MVIQHSKGVQHGNADPLSRHPDNLKYCDCYEVGVTLDSLPCGGVNSALVCTASGHSLKMMWMISYHLLSKA